MNHKSTNHQCYAKYDKSVSNIFLRPEDILRYIHRPQRFPTMSPTRGKHTNYMQTKIKHTFILITNIQIPKCRQRNRKFFVVNRIPFQLGRGLGSCTQRALGGTVPPASLLSFSRHPVPGRTNQAPGRLRSGSFFKGRCPPFLGPLGPLPPPPDPGSVDTSLTPPSGLQKKPGSVLLPNGSIRLADGTVKPPGTRLPEAGAPSTPITAKEGRSIFNSYNFPFGLTGHLPAREVGCFGYWGGGGFFFTKANKSRVQSRKAQTSDSHTKNHQQKQSSKSRSGDN